ncbi:MAG: FCD domain-containing protein, partial [Pseudomonadota bacterium]
ELLRRGVFYNRSVIYAEQNSRDTLLDQHRAIHDAVIAGDAAAARAASEAHLDFIQIHLAAANRVRTREEIAKLRQEQEKRMTGGRPL